MNWKPEPVDDFYKSEAVRRHTKDRGKNVTTRWQLVARDLFAENAKLREDLRDTQATLDRHLGTNLLLR